MTLARMLSPKSAVFIGGSDLVPVIEATRQNQFSGDLFVVNESDKTLAGLNCYSTVEELPSTPDLAFVDGADKTIVNLVKTLAEQKCGGVVVSGGFEPELGEQWQRIREVAGDMPVLGPNSMGFANFADHSVFIQGHVADYKGTAKGVAAIGYGSSISSDFFMADRSLPLAYAVGMGDQAVLRPSDILEFVIDDDRVSAIFLYLESVYDVPALSKISRKAVRRGLPIVVVRGGRTTAGNRVAHSPEQNLQGEDDTITALFNRLGFIQCSSTEEAIETLKMLIFTGRPLGRRLTVSASSSSFAVIGADKAESVGLKIEDITPELAAEVKRLLPKNTNPSNPLVISPDCDITYEEQRKIFRSFFKNNAELAVQIMCFPADETIDSSAWIQLADAFAQEAADQQLPCAFINTLPETLPKEVREKMIENGMAPLQGLAHGMQAIINAFKFIDQEIRLAQLPSAAIEMPEPITIRKYLQLDEAQGKEALHRTGVTVPKAVVIQSGIPMELDALRYPVAVKALSPKLTHKTELGAIRLNIANDTQARQAIFDINDLIESIQPTGFLIEEMVIDGIGEILIGVRHVQSIGQVLTIAVGGVSVELIRDIRTLLLPTSSSEIEYALRSLKLFPIFEGWRGKPAADLDAVVEAIATIASYAVAQRQRLFALEINPLIVRPAPHPPVVADVVLQLGESISLD